jgi:hypothetical protein
MMRGLQLVNFAKTRVRVDRVLNRGQIVGYGDDREQNQNEQGKGDKLRSPFLTRAGPNPQPQAHEGETHECPIRLRISSILILKKYLLLKNTFS